MPAPPPSTWQLHEQLLKDSYPVIDLPCCNVRLLNDCRFPWVLLIPRIAAVSSWFELDRDVQQTVNDEINRVGQTLQALYAPRRINIGIIGNRVEQLHIHCIARSPDDPAWPDVVWGFDAPIPYAPLDRLDRCSRISAGLTRISAPD